MPCIAEVVNRSLKADCTDFMFDCYMLSFSFNGICPGDELGIFTDRDQGSILGGFEFQESVFSWVLVTAAVLFGLLNKNCILKCFIFSTVFFGSSFIHQMVQ